MTLTCVGIDESKGKSPVSALGWGDVVLMKPYDVLYTASALSELADLLERLPGEVRVVMEHTGRYWLPVAQVLCKAGLFVSAVNPKLVRDFGDNKLRSIKNDKADSRKLSRYGLKCWTDLVPYVPIEITRQKLLEFSRQLDASNKLLTGLKNNLQAIVDVTVPGVHKLLKKTTAARGFFGKRLPKGAELLWLTIRRVGTVLPPNPKDRRGGRGRAAQDGTAR